MTLTEFLSRLSQQTGIGVRTDGPVAALVTEFQKSYMDAVAVEVRRLRTEARKASGNIDSMRADGAISALGEMLTFLGVDPKAMRCPECKGEYEQLTDDGTCGGLWCKRTQRPMSLGGRP